MNAIKTEFAAAALAAALLCLPSAALAAPAAASAAPSGITFMPAPPKEQLIHRVVVKFRSASVAAAAAPAGAGHATAMGGPAVATATLDIAKSLSVTASGATPDRAHIASVSLRAARGSGERSVVYELDQAVTPARAKEIAESLLKDPRVEAAEPDVVVRTMAVNDGPMPAGGSMWNLDRPSATNLGASDFERAWALVPPGSARVRIAVIDTGSTVHPDFTANDTGPNFISDPDVSGKVDRGAAGMDNGDYCAERPSSWHGLMVGSTIAAVVNNRYGVAGAAGGFAQVHTLRGIGRCGGYLTDIADAVRWAAGLPVAGIAANNTPSKVINLSVGAGGVCPAFMQEAVTAAVSAGVTIVAAAGNDGGWTISMPANCAGVIAVTAGTKSGDLANYSNTGSEAALMAPAGGGCRLQGPAACDPTTVVALSNTGLSAPGEYVDARAVAGTSFSTPNVAAAAALLLAADPNLSPAEIKRILQKSARPFPAGSWCASQPGLCGSGILDAYAAVMSTGIVLPPPSVSIARAPELPYYAGNTQITVSSTATSGLPPYKYTWTQISGPPVALASSTEASTRLTTPTQGSITQPIVLSVSVTSADGQMTAVLASVAVGNAPTVSLQSPGDKLGVPGTSLRIPLNVTDPDGQAVSLRLLDAPAGLVGIVNGTAGHPTAELVWSSPVAGTYVVRVQAVDSDGLSAAQDASFTLTVTAKRDAGETTPPDPATTPGAGSLSFQWVALLAAAVVCLWRVRPGSVPAAPPAPRAPRQGEEEHDRD